MYIYDTYIYIFFFYRVSSIPKPYSSLKAPPYVSAAALCRGDPGSLGGARGSRAEEAWLEEQVAWVLVEELSLFLLRNFI